MYPARGCRSLAGQNPESRMVSSFGKSEIDGFIKSLILLNVVHKMTFYEAIKIRG